MNKKTIDVHHHFYTQEYIKELSSIGVVEGGGSQFPKWEPEKSLEVMERYGIDVSILSVPMPVWYFEDTKKMSDIVRSLNEFGTDIVKQWPSRFGVLATLPLPDVEATLREINYAYDILHVDGVNLMSNYQGFYLGDPCFEKVFAELDRRKAVVAIHPSVFTGSDIPSSKNAGSPIKTLEPSLFEFIFDTTRAVANLVISGTVKRYPNIKFILSHAGGTVPFVANRIIDRSEIIAFYQKVQAGEIAPPAPEVFQEMLKDAQKESLRQLGSMYYDTTFSVNVHEMSSLQKLVENSHIVLGTDYPLAQEIGMRSNMSDLRSYEGLSEHERYEIETNALKLFPRFNN